MTEASHPVAVSRAIDAPLAASRGGALRGFLGALGRSPLAVVGGAILLFWTIKKLAEDRIDQIDFPPEYAGAAAEVARLLKDK